MNSGAAIRLIIAALQALFAAVGLGVSHAAGSLVCTASELLDAAIRLCRDRLSGTATWQLGSGLRRTAARLGFIVARGRAFGAAFPNNGTAALVLSTALLALLATTKPSFGIAAGVLVFATAELCRATILGLIAGNDGSGQKHAKGEE